jgi:hypothetical protein
MTTKRRMFLALPTALAAVALAATPAVAATLTTASPSPTPSPTVAPAPQTTSGIIMRDGGICDPIRHMGC